MSNKTQAIMFINGLINNTNPYFDVNEIVEFYAKRGDIDVVNQYIKFTKAEYRFKSIIPTGGMAVKGIEFEAYEFTFQDGSVLNLDVDSLNNKIELTGK